jgi:tryptophan-rich sensory protein
VRWRTDFQGQRENYHLVVEVTTKALPFASPRQTKRMLIMLYTVALVLIILWLLGLVTSNTLGGFIHILLVIAVVVVLLRIISGRSPL